MSENQSLRELILSTEDIQSEVVTVPQWGNAKLEIRGMSGKERSRLMQICVDPKTQEIDFSRLYPLIIVATAFDPETGEKVFSSDDIDALNEKSGAALEYVGKVAARLSGMDREDVEELGKL